MRRKEIAQISTSNKTPKWLRSMISEFLSWFVLRVNATKPFIPVIEEALEKADNKHIINIDFGLGAGISTVQPFLESNISVSNLPLEHFTPEKKGVYLFINSFHQLHPNKAIEMLQAIVKNRQSLVVLEGNNDSLWQVVGMTVFVPLTVIFTAPLVRPFRISRLFFTYILPILPFIIMLDGCIALFKLYSLKDLDKLVGSIRSEDYEWKRGKNDNGRGGKIIYLVGHPPSVNI
jgi:hypothetical protein